LSFSGDQQALAEILPVAGLLTDLLAWLDWTLT
jgi:hypothetical protein